MSRVKIAYLIVAHDNPAHLLRLTKALSSSSSSIFIHVDRKSRSSDFSDIQGPNITFSPERVPVYWGDFSQVEAVLVLLRMALADERRFDYFVLLSGVDYPLHTPATIERFFARNAGDEFISVERMPSETKPLSRLSFFRARPSDRWPTRFAVKLAKAFGIKIGRDYAASLGKLIPYAGWSWWALSRDACTFIQDFVATQPRVIDFFKNTRCPDKSLFHTILANSPFKARIRTTLTYADWSSGGSSPVFIAAEHIEAFKSKSLFSLGDRYRPGDILFARKFSDLAASVVAELDLLRMEEEAART